MDILHNIIEITDNKFSTLLHFLDNDLQTRYKYYQLADTLYLNDMIHCIRKDTLDIEYKGRIKKINDKIQIRHNNFNININPGEYYILTKPSKSKMNDRKFFESLLNNL